MTALVKASPRRNGQTQINKRIERRGSDQRIKRVIVDIVDMRTGLKGQASDRAKVYKEMGYSIYTTRISHEQIKLPEPEKKAEALAPVAAIPDSEIDNIIAGLMDADTEDPKSSEDTPAIGIDDLYGEAAE